MPTLSQRRTQLDYDEDVALAKRLRRTPSKPYKHVQKQTIESALARIAKCKHSKISIAFSQDVRCKDCGLHIEVPGNF